MANEEVLGPRKTMFVLVIVVGCFAVLWPRIISPLILGHSRDQLKPNQFDRDAALKQERPLRGAGPHPALRERGRAIPAGTPAAPRPVVMPPHVRVRSSPLAGYFEIDVKPPPIPGMRPPLGSPGGPAPTPKSSMGFVMPIYTICIIVFFVYTLSKILFKRTGSTPYETVTPDPQFRRRVFRDDSRTSPDKLVVTAISGLVAEVQQQMEASYAQNQQRQDVQDNNARPYTNGTVLHNNGPVHIVASEYKEASKEKTPKIEEEAVEHEPETKEKTPEPQEPISDEAQEELIPETKEVLTLEESASELEEATTEPKSSPEPKEPTPEPKESTPEPKESTPEPKESSPEPKETTPEPKESTPETNKSAPEPKESTPEQEEQITELKDDSDIQEKETEDPEETSADKEEDKLIETNDTEIKEILLEALKDESNELNAFTDNLKVRQNGDVLTQSTKEFLMEETKALQKEDEKSTPELLEDAIKDEDEELDPDEHENTSVKVMGMELTAQVAEGGAWTPQSQPGAPRAQSGAPRAQPGASPQPALRPHEAEEVQSIFLETDIPQQSRVLVARCDPATDTPHKHVAAAHEPLVVSGKMTLSLIQDAPRDTPERDPESTVDDFTTASALTQPAEKEDESEEEIEEEIEEEEIEEEVEVEEDEEDEEEPKKDGKEHKKVEKGPE